MVLEKTPESPLGSKEIKLFNLKEIDPEYSLEQLMLKMKLRYFGHLMRTADSLEKPLQLGKIDGRRRRGRQRLRWLDGITEAMDMNLGKGTGRPGVLQSMSLQSVRHDWVTEQQAAEKNTGK